MAVRPDSYIFPTSGGNPLSPHSLPPISILKPLKGLDDNLFDNLESFCKQDYPCFEILFSLQGYNDPAYKVVKKIKEKYSQNDISIIVENCTIGLNPKVNNLIPSYHAAKYPYILISDSNVMVECNYLKEIIRHMENPKVSLVTNLIKGIGSRTLASIFENLHLNSFVIGSVSFLCTFLKIPCVVGKSMLIRKSDLELIGSLTGVKDVLAEDYIIGKKLHEAGKKVVLSACMICNVNKYWGMKKFLNRHTRWGKLRWNIAGIAYFSELLTNPVFLSFILFLLWPSQATFFLMLAVCSLKGIGDFSLGRRIGSDLKPLHYSLVPVKDLIIGLIWFIPLVSSTVVWRGNRYSIGKNTILSPCQRSGVQSWRYRFTDSLRTVFAGTPVPVNLRRRVCHVYFEEKNYLKPQN